MFDIPGRRHSPTVWSPFESPHFPGGEALSPSPQSLSVPSPSGNTGTTAGSLTMLECCSSEPTSVGQGWGGSQNPSVASFLQNVDQVSRGSAFVLSNPPLAALHNMTEMKVPPVSSSLMCSSQNPVYTSMSQAALKQMALNSSAAGTPHGIHDILTRNHSALAAHYGQLTGLPRLNVGGSPGGVYLNSAVASRFPKPIAELPGRTPIYWPGVLQNPAWRPTGVYGKQNANPHIYDTTL